MASRVLQVEVIGDAASAERAFKRAGTAASGFERDVTKSGRGAIAASGAFKGLGRSVAFASSSFLGAAGLIDVMKSSVSAAEDLKASSIRLQTVIDNLGLSYKSHAKEISNALDAEERLSAFTKQDLTDALGKLVPATHDVTKALQDVSLAADVARSRHMDLQAATLLVVKAQEGQTAGLKRMGIEIQPVKDAENALIDSHEKFTTATKAAAKALDAHATSLKAIKALTDTYGGSAKNATTESQKFSDEIHQLEVAIGQALLPALDNVIGKLTPMIDEWTKTGRATRDVKAAVHDATDAFKVAKDVIHEVDKVTGGFKQTLELLVAIKLLPVLRAWTGEMKAFAGASALGAAESESAGLLGNLTRLKGLGPIGVAIALSFIPKAKASSDPNAASNNPALKFFAGLPVVGGLFSQANRASDWLNNALGITGGSSGGGSGGGGGLTGPPGAPISGGATKAAIVASAKAHGVDPVAALAVAAAEGGFSGAIGDGGHAFGPFQMNNAGGVATGMGGGFLQGFANSRAGIDFAMKKIAAVAGGLTGYDAIRAIVTRFERPADGGAGDLQRATAFLMGGGVSSMAAIQSGGGGGVSGASIASLLSQGTTKKKKASILHGSSLLSSSLLDAITGAKNNATDSSGTIAAKWLHTELSDLKKAHAELEHKLAGATGKQKAAIDAELRTVDSQIAGVNKQITTNLHQQAQAVKASFSSLISGQKSAISSAASQVKSDLDAQFAAATQAYIDNVIGPKYFQGTDASGMGLQTPQEQALAAFNNAQAKKQRDDALSTAQKQLTLDQQDVTVTADQIAQDQAAVQAAKDAITQAQLEADATASRAQADHDYAQAVKQYQADRTNLEHQLNDQIDAWAKGLANGTTKVSDLAGAVAAFGLSLGDPSSGVIGDFDVLASAVTALAATMSDEAQRLAGLGDAADARRIRNVAGAMGALSAGGGVVSGLGGGDGYFLLNPIQHPAGGVTVSPTFITPHDVMGEAGPEALIPLDNHRSLSMIAAAIGNDGTTVVPVYLDGSLIYKVVQTHAARDVKRGGAGVPG